MASELIEFLNGDLAGMMVSEDQLSDMFLDTSPSPDEPGVNDEQLQAIVKSRLDEAVNYAEEELAAVRAQEQQYYDGEELDGDENLDNTRSKMISRDVHDTIHAILPSIMRVFFSGRSVVEYMPVGPEDEPFARQATQYVNEVVLQQDNDAFHECYNVCHDGLLKGLGPIIWFWHPHYEVEGQSYRGINEQEYRAIVADINVTGLSVLNEYDDELGQHLYDCDITYRRMTGGKARIESVPPEERLIDKRARSKDDAEVYGRRRVLTVSEVVAMGYDYDQVVTLGGSELLDTNEEQTERYESHIFDTEAGTSDPSMRKLEYCDIYIRVDRDGDGFAELYHIACGGQRRTILEYADGRGPAIQLVNEIPAAEFCPDPVPHLATGRSIARKVMDVQKAKTNMIRAVFDSLGRAIFPDQEVVNSQVNMDDVLNPEIGKIIRTKAPGMMREVTTTFMGKEAMPVLGYLDGLKANRTGITDVTQGLDPQALQSTSANAVHAVTAAAQNQTEMIARLFAHQVMVPLFKGLLKLIKTHQDKARTVRLRNEWVQVDPQYWNAGMDVRINTALGRGTEMEKISFLSKVAEEQKHILESMGPINPICTAAEYRNTLAEMTNLAGFPNDEKFFLPVNMQQVMQQIQQQIQQMQQELQQAQQQLMVASMELEGHSAAEDTAKHAKALKDRIDGFDKLVDALGKANQQNISPDALADEMVAGQFLLQ